MSFQYFGRRNTGMVLAGGLIALVGGVIGGGCGGIDTSTVEGFCQAAAQIDCSQAVVMACFGATDTSLDTDTNNCINSRSLISNCNPLHLQYHADFASACLAEHQNAYANASYDANEAQTLYQACLPAFNNGGAQGTSCSSDSDCDAGNQFVCVAGVGGKGTCQVPVAVMGGDKCAAPTAQCPTNDYCDQTAHCVADGATGDACGAGQPCGTGFRCNTAGARCEPQFADGQACNVNSDCENGFCLAVGGSTGAKGLCSGMYTFAFGAPSCATFTSL